MSTNAAVTINTTEDGVFFEDLLVGQILLSRSSIITQKDINDFAELSLDFNQIHRFSSSAKEAGLPDTIAHGALVFARATGLAWQIGLFRKANTIFREANLEFVNFVFPEDSISLRLEIVELKALTRLKKGKVTLAVRVYNQHGSPVANYTWVALVSMRPTKEANSP